MREFGLKGIDGASTREIAAAAGTVMSSITYHYGGKDGLYLACADYIVTRMSDDERMAAALSVPLDGLSFETARAQIHAVLDSFVDRMVGPASADWALFIIREQLDPTEAFERIYGGLIGGMMERLADLVCIVSGRQDREAARVVTITLLAQALVLRAARASCLKLLQRADIDGSAVATLKARIHANIDAILDTLTADRQEPQ